jgi:hypothetical protein
VMFDRFLGYRSMLMLCRSMMVGGFDRDDVRSSFGLSINVDVLSIAGGGGFDRDDVRAGFRLSIAYGTLRERC